MKDHAVNPIIRQCKLSGVPGGSEASGPLSKGFTNKNQII